MTTHTPGARGGGSGLAVSGLAMPARRPGRRLWGWGLLLLLLAGPATAGAENLVLKVRAINPSAVDRQKVEVKAYLPKPARAEDVVNAGELEVAYDVHQDAYYVHKEVELEPKQVKTFEVTLRDVWVIPEEELSTAGAHAVALAAALRGTEERGSAEQLRAAIEANLKALRERQEANRVSVAKPLEHIRAYETNREVLERVRKDLALLENLAIAVGKDPEKILGAPALAPTPERADLPRGTNVLLWRIQVRNPSLTTRKTVPVRRELPAEIKPADVLDAGGLQVGFDAGRGLCYVYLDDLELDPQGMREFEVRLRNPWAANRARVLELRARTTNLLAVARATEAYKSVSDLAQEVLRGLDVLERQPVPAVLNEEYVAFFRAQAQSLNQLESQTLRLEELFQPREKPLRIDAPILDIQRPSRRTTWGIIYLVLIFLAVVSLLFFLRWYGRSKAERLERLAGSSAQAPGGAAGGGPAGP